MVGVGWERSCEIRTSFKVLVEGVTAIRMGWCFTVGFQSALRVTVYLASYAFLVNLRDPRTLNVLNGPPSSPSEAR